MCDSFCDCQMLRLAGSYDDQFYYLGSVVGGGGSTVTVTHALKTEQTSWHASRPATSFLTAIKYIVGNQTNLWCIKQTYGRTNEGYQQKRGKCTG